MAISPGAPPPPRAEPTRQETPIGYQYVFLSIVAAIVVAFILFPGATLGAFYPPCTYVYPRPTPVPGLIAGSPTATLTPTATPSDTPTPTVTPSPSPSPTGTLTPGPSTATPLPTSIPASAASATARVKEIVAAGHVDLQSDTGHYPLYAHSLA